MFNDVLSARNLTFHIFSSSNQIPCFPNENTTDQINAITKNDREKNYLVNFFLCFSLLHLIKIKGRERILSSRQRSTVSVLNRWNMTVPLFSRNRKFFSLYHKSLQVNNCTNIFLLALISFSFSCEPQK